MKGTLLTHGISMVVTQHLDGQLLLLLGPPTMIVRLAVETTIPRRFGIKARRPNAAWGEVAAGRSASVRGLENLVDGKDHLEDP